MELLFQLTYHEKYDGNYLLEMPVFEIEWLRDRIVVERRKEEQRQKDQGKFLYD